MWLNLSTLRFNQVLVHVYELIKSATPTQCTCTVVKGEKTTERNLFQFILLCPNKIYQFICLFLLGFYLLNTCLLEANVQNVACAHSCFLGFLNSNIHLYILKSLKTNYEGFYISITKKVECFLPFIIAWSLYFSYW